MFQNVLLHRKLKNFRFRRDRTLPLNSLQSDELKRLIKVELLKEMLDIICEIRKFDLSFKHSAYTRHGRVSRGVAGEHSE